MKDFHKVFKTTLIFLEKLIPLVGTIFILRANVLLFFYSRHTIQLVWFWAIVSTAPLLYLFYINLKDLRKSVQFKNRVESKPKYYLLVNLALIAFLFFTFLDLAVADYFQPVGAYEPVVYGILYSFLFYIIKLIIDSLKLIIAHKNMHFVKEFYLVFIAFFVISGLWIITQPGFRFQHVITKNRIDLFWGNKTYAPGESVAGGQKAYVLGTTDSPYGYLVYEPKEKAVSNTGKYPLMVFFHGGDERGNNEDNNGALVWGTSKHGPSRLIRRGDWTPPEPTIVISPQSPANDKPWDAERIHKFMKYVVKTYQVDTNRIYLTGISMGGTGAIDYVNMYGDDAYATALLPLATSGTYPEAFVPENFKNIPIWTFNNDNDPYAGHMQTIGQVQQINAINNKSRITLYPQLGHDAWTLVYNMKLMDKGVEFPEYDAFDRNVYEWLYQFSK